MCRREIGIETVAQGLKINKNAFVSSTQVSWWALVRAYITHDNDLFIIN